MQSQHLVFSGVEAVPAPHPRGELTVSHNSRTATGVLQCLVVSVSPARREMLLQAARDGGWQTLVAADAEAARAHLKRYLVQLAIVDLERTSKGEPADFHTVLQELAGQAGVLLIVCGNDGAAPEEIWARQLGVWLYLPGVIAGDDVALLCEEARQITEQLAATRQGAAPEEKRLRTRKKTSDFRPQTSDFRKKA